MHDRIIPKLPKEKMGWSPFLRKGARLQFPFVQTCFPNLRSLAQPDSGLTESKQKQYRAIWKIFSKLSAISKEVLKADLFCRSPQKIKFTFQIREAAQHLKTQMRISDLVSIFFFFIFWIKWAKPNDKLTK